MGTTKAQLIESVLRLQKEGKTLEQITAELAAQNVSGIDREKLATDANAALTKLMPADLKKQIGDFITAEKARQKTARDLQKRIAAITEKVTADMTKTFGDVSGILYYDGIAVIDENADDDTPSYIVARELTAKARAKRQVVHDANFRAASGYRLVKNAKPEKGNESHAKIYAALKKLAPPFSNAEIGAALKDVLGTERKHFKFAQKGGESWSYLIERVYKEDASKPDASAQNASAAPASA